MGFHIKTVKQFLETLNRLNAMEDIPTVNRIAHKSESLTPYLAYQLVHKLERANLLVRYTDKKSHGGRIEITKKGIEFLETLEKLES